MEENNIDGAGRHHTPTFVGYLVAGFRGSLISTIGIFLPSFILVLVAAPLLAKYRLNTNVQGFVKGAYAAAIGTILGACVLLGKIAVGDWLTVLIVLAPLALLFLWKVNNPILIAATTVIGLVAYPLLQRDGEIGIRCAPKKSRSPLRMTPMIVSCCWHLNSRPLPRRRRVSAFLTVLAQFMMMDHVFTRARWSKGAESCVVDDIGTNARQQGVSRAESISAMLSSRNESPQAARVLGRLG